MWYYGLCLAVYQGPDGMTVSVLDAVQRPSTNFLSHRPAVASGTKYEDLEFTKRIALEGKYSHSCNWSRPQVR